ncbi:MAG: FlgD immunoglobulin-like domain containing protein [Candidatus Eisenbacteria bacterium]
MKFEMSWPGDQPSGRFQRAIASVLGLLLLSLPAGVGFAATPPSGSLSTGSPSVTWSGGLVSGANVDETTCIEGATCDTYTLTLLPGDYTGKRITVGINWLVPANDYDLYVHQGTPSGPIVGQSAGGAPSTTERASIQIDPPVVAVARVYSVHVVTFTVTPGDIYQGDASLVATPLPRVANYLAGNLTFSPNVTLRAPVAAQDGEPSVRVDTRGNYYVSGIRGVPAGVDLWRYDLNPTSPTFDPGLQNPIYLGQPDAFLPQDPNDPTTGGADGGGDVDLATSFPASPDSTPVLTLVSLAAANISSAYSFDRGAMFTLSPATAIAPADDRQWIEADSANTVYMLYRAPIPATGLFVQRSDDHGLTYPVTSVVNPSGTTPGYIDVDHRNGTVYVAHTGSNSLVVANSTDRGVSWKNNTVDNTTSHGNLFDVVKVGDDGTVYTVWSDQFNIYMAHSTNGGVSWSEKVRVNDAAVYKTNLMPWLEAGSAGRVIVVWYGTTSATNSDDADWRVLCAQALDATATSPTFAQQVISDHVIHGSNISLGGLTGAANRNLDDYFQVALDPQGAAVLSYTDDHNDYNGHLYVTRQMDGSSLYASANGGSGTVNPIYPPPPPPPNPSPPQVSDFLHDAVTGLLAPIPTDNAFDLLSVGYTSEACESPQRLTVVIKVSSLTAIPSGMNWRASFAANVPGGVSDRGDQFYVMANSDNPAVLAYTYGTAVRVGDGSLAYTSRGTADFGMVDAAQGTITIQVALNKLNPFVTHGPPIGPGSRLDGLRAATFTDGANGIRDQTRGGSYYLLSPCSPTPTLMTLFDAQDTPDGIAIEWQFGPTADVTSVRVERADAADGPWQAVEVERSAQGEATVALDRTAEAGRAYYYRLYATRADGSTTTFGPVSAVRGASAPTVSFLHAPKPNPSTGTSSVEFGVARSGFVELAVFDVAGRRVRTIVAQTMAPGSYARAWDGRTDRFSNATSGIYFYVLSTAEGVKTSRIVLTR